LLLDLGEFRGFDYYDGVVFDVFASGVGAELGGGGRYDHLIGRFGRNLPSTGFALDVDHLFRAVEFPEAPDSTRLEYVVAGPRRSARAVIELARRLRQRRRRVVQLLVKGSEQTLVSHALAAAQAQGADALIVVGAPGVDQDQVALFENLGIHNARRNGRPHRPVMKKVSREAVLTSGRSRHRRGAGT
jgi:ATP phosphoribosyltransferase regulatory subunit